MGMNSTSSIRDAVILASGKGLRLRNEVYDCSKPMTPILGKPLISYTIDSLINCGVNNIVVVYHSSSVDLLNIGKYNRNYKDVISFVEDTKQIGKLTAFYCAKDLVDSPFLLTYGDVVVKKEDFKDMLNLALQLTDKNPDLAVQTVEKPSIPVKEPFEKPMLVQNGRIIKWKKEGAVIDAEIQGSEIKAGAMVYLWFKNPFPLMANFLQSGNFKYSVFLEKFVPTHIVFEMPVRDMWDIDVPENISHTERILQDIPITVENSR